MCDLQEDDMINFRALRKIDENIAEILFNAGQVAIYTYNLDSGNWQRKEIEGTLFLVKRNVYPQFAFVVINKISTVNLVQKITSDFETNVNLPYLMYKNTESEIYCVWFYNRENCVNLNNKIVEIIGVMKQNKLLSQMASGQLNGLAGGGAISNPTQAISELLKIRPEGEANNCTEVEPPKAFQPVSQIESAKAPSQRKSINLKDLFASQINISNNTTNSNAGEHLTTLKEEERVKVVKPQPVTPYQAMKEGKVKNNIVIPNASLIGTPSNSNSNNHHAEKDIILKSLDTILQPQKMVATPSPAFEQMSSTPKVADKDVPLYLTMEQLKKTLVHLLQNDADFLHNIHTAYVSAIKK